MIGYGSGTAPRTLTTSRPHSRLYSRAARRTSPSCVPSPRIFRVLSGTLSRNWRTAASRFRAFRALRLDRLRAEPELVPPLDEPARDIQAEGAAAADPGVPPYVENTHD